MMPFLEKRFAASQSNGIDAETSGDRPDAHDLLAARRGRPLALEAHVLRAGNRCTGGCDQSVNEMRRGRYVHGRTG